MVAKEVEDINRRFVSLKIVHFGTEARKIYKNIVVETSEKATICESKTKEVKKMQCTEITQTRGESVLPTSTSNENTVKDLYDENQQRECKTLLAEFPNLFTRSEHDIGRINLVEQTINT